MEPIFLSSTKLEKQCVKFVIIIDQPEVFVPAAQLSRRQQSFQQVDIRL